MARFKCRPQSVVVELHSVPECRRVFSETRAVKTNPTLIAARKLGAPTNPPGPILFDRCPPRRLAVKSKIQNLSISILIPKSHFDNSNFDRIWKSQNLEKLNTVFKKWRVARCSGAHSVGARAHDTDRARPLPARPAGERDCVAVLPLRIRSDPCHPGRQVNEILQLSYGNPAIELRPPA